MDLGSTATLAKVIGEKGYALRLPPELKRKMERWAALERRSLNAQIVRLLERAVTQAEKSGELPKEPQHDR